MNRNMLLSAAVLASVSALALAPSFAQDAAPSDSNAADSNAAKPDNSDQATDADTLDLDGKIVTGPVYIVQDPKTGTTYVLVPENEAPAKAWSPVRGVTAWA